MTGGGGVQPIKCHAPMFYNAVQVDPKSVFGEFSRLGVGRYMEKS